MGGTETRNRKSWESLDVLEEAIDAIRPWNLEIILLIVLVG